MTLCSERSGWLRYLHLIFFFDKFQLLEAAVFKFSAGASVQSPGLYAAASEAPCALWRSASMRSTRPLGFEPLRPGLGGGPSPMRLMPVDDLGPGVVGALAGRRGVRVRLGRWPWRLDGPVQVP